MKVKLVVKSGARRGVLPLNPPEAIVGRGRGNAVRIPSAEVSRQHCRLILRDGIVRVEDMESVNGTYLNNRKIRRIEPVMPGDRLSIGPVTFSVEYDLTEGVSQRCEDEEPAELLELLDDDAILEVEDLLPLDSDEEGLLPAIDADLELPVEDDIAIMRDVSLEKPWKVPDDNAFRDVLSQLTDEDDPSPAKQR